MENIIDLFIQLAFELGQAYGKVYSSAGLENIIDFNDIAFANSRGAQWNIKGNMSDLPELYKIHEVDQNKIDALNEIANNLQNIKVMAKEKITKEV